MALQKARPSEIPPDAVRLSKEEAVEHQTEVMLEWKDWKDRFFFKYGSSILAGASAGVGVYLNDHYRKKLKLGHYGSKSSFLATAVIPAGISLIFHYTLVVPSVILRDTCPVCTEIRAASIQAVIGCAMPAVLAPLAGFSNALNYGTYNVPYVTEPMKVLRLWRKLSQPIGNVLFGLFLAQALLGAGVTILESRDLDVVNAKLELRYSSH